MVEEKYAQRTDEAMSATAVTPRISDQALGRLLKWGAVFFVLLLVGFAAFYWATQRVDVGPSTTERQISAAEQAVEKAPRSLPTRISLAQAYREAGRIDDAMAQFNEVIKADKGNIDALLGRAEVNMDQGALDAAKADFTAILTTGGSGEFARMDKRMAAANYFLGTIAVKQGHPDQAVTAAQAALNVDATDSDALYLLGTAYEAQNKHAEAVAAFLSALRFVPVGWCEPFEGLQGAWSKMGSTAQATYAQGMADFCRGKQGQAVATLQGLTSGPMAAEAMAGLGLIAETANDGATATNWYQKSIAKDPKNVNALGGLSRLGVKPATTDTAK